MCRRPCPEPLHTSRANRTPRPPSNIRMKSCCPHPAGPRKGRWTQRDTATWAGLCTHSWIKKDGVPSPGPTRPLLSLFLPCLCNQLAHSFQLRACHSGLSQTVPAGKLVLTSVISTLFQDSHSHVCLHHVNTSWDY